MLRDERIFQVPSYRSLQEINEKLRCFSRLFPPPPALSPTLICFAFSPCAPPAVMCLSKLLFLLSDAVSADTYEVTIVDAIVGCNDS